MTRDELKTFLAPLADEAILGLTLYGEARGEAIEGVIAVGCVIRNRLLDRRWPNTYRDVCLQKAQFSCWAPIGGEANFNTMIEAAKGLLANQPAPALLEQCAWVALGISRGALLDTTKGANHYHAVSMHPRPKWAQSFIPVVQKGQHVFYKLPPITKAA
jgi:N-acetylmuramoyl-L-alanine amidase